MAADSWGGSRSVEPEAPSKLVGAGFQAFEDSVLAKLQKLELVFKLLRIPFLRNCQ
ncbi:dnaJ heat shock amino-terminal domain protein, partial [Trifolium medium]|nr:dnaJ heat shock amino-terminal domain protein [Trifolium medium]